LLEYEFIALSGNPNIGTVINNNLCFYHDSQ